MDSLGGRGTTILLLATIWLTHWLKTDGLTNLWGAITGNQQVK